MSTIEAKILNEVIRKRRSIYPYQYKKGKVVPDQIIWQILENANHAPNHKQTEPWRFTVFTGDGLQYFGELQQKIYKENVSNNFNQGRYDKLLAYPLLSSHVIAVGMKRNEKNILPEIEEIQAVACAIENMFLTVTAYGLGCYLSTAGITYIEAAKTYFKLDTNDKLIGFFYIGYLGIESLPESKRRPIREKTTWINQSSKNNI